MSNNESGSSSKFAIIGIFAVAVIAAFIFLLTRRGDDKTKAAASASAETPTVPSAMNATTVTFLYSTEKKAWITESVDEFQKANPDVSVKLVARGSLDAVNDIMEGKEKPTLWSPADNVAINLLASDWQQKTQKHIVAESGDDAPQPLVVTPLVFVAWEDRGKVLTKNGEGVTWHKLHEVLSSTKGWPAIGGSADWGFVKLGHTNPTRSNSGLQALLLMAYSYHDKRSGLEIKDILDDKFQDFVKVIEKGVPKFGDSTGTFMKDMVLYGPSKYDIVVTYENLAIQSIPNAQGRWGNLRVYYPKLTMWSSHPVAVLDADWVTPQEKAAGKRLIAFLRAKDAQQKALRHGFRPADPSVPIIDKSPDNPFSAAKAFGVRVDIPTVVEPPPGPVVRNMLEMWSRVVGR
jgi:hypothetical protein